MMLKCGQTDNKKYTFGEKKDQEEKVAELMKKVGSKAEDEVICLSCGSCLKKGSKVCSACGEKV